MFEPAGGTRTPLVLASGSPRRSDLLAKLGVSFEVRSADIDETPIAGESPDALLRRLAEQKARAVWAALDVPCVVLGADTIVVLDGEILGKPTDASEARQMLRSLSGRSHEASTGVAVVDVDGVAAVEVSTTVVTMHPISESDIDWYLATGEPFDKAGSYALQGHGGVFVEKIDGNMASVIGLPLDITRRMLEAVGISLANPGDCDMKSVA